MGTQNLDATIRVRVDAGDAEKDVAKLDRDLERRERKTDREKREKKREREKSRQTKGRVGVTGGIGGRAAKLAGSLLVVTAALESVEFLGPVIAQIVENNIKKLGIPALTLLAKGNRELAEFASDQVSDLRATLSAAFGTAKGVGDAARAVGILGGKEMTTDQAWDFAKRLYLVTKTLDRADRQNQKLVRERIVKTFADLIDPTSFFK